MRILHTVGDTILPFIGGMSEVVKQLSNYMASFGHDITVATSYHSERRFNLMNGVKVEAFKLQVIPSVEYKENLSVIRTFC